MVYVSAVDIPHRQIRNIWTDIKRGPYIKNKTDTINLSFEIGFKLWILKTVVKISLSGIL